ncbi:unnamed protein product [Rotaria sordida]|uniref:Uncharacterized protein n=1 Tax=Rotaria sordida TaxID=392033 RepID=A0A814A9A7_9BILA|nr:unnamed protein product [Rotaria sordida]
MRQSNKSRVNQTSNLPEPSLSYNKHSNDYEFIKERPLKKLRSQKNTNDDFVKPELPEFLQNMGPGLSPLKENPPVTLSWHDVRAITPVKQNFITKKLNECLGKEAKRPKELLKGVSGIIKSGEMCAIMGASGAGKTTLMNILTHRRPGKLHISADVRINGQKMKRDISGVSGFVQQEELFVGSLTIQEHLQFHSMLRLGKEYTQDERINRVDEVIEFLNLTKVKNTTIGIPGVVKSLSGGEKRRVTFATEILSDPPLLFCDEPTSGLDSSMAFILIQAMRKLADQGKTIICTIHQPSSEIFFLYDKLYLLAEGRLAYFGSLEKAPAFFRQFGLEIPRNYNPADFYIQQLAIYPKTSQKNLTQIKHICDGYEKSSEYSRYKSEINSLHSTYTEDDNDNFFLRLFNRCCSEDEQNDLNDNDIQHKKTSRYKTNSFTQFRWLLWRNFVNIFKNPFEIRLNIILALFMGVLLGLLYNRLKYDQTGVQNFNSLIFLTIINTSFLNIVAITQSYTKEFPIFYKEHDDAVYRMTPYYFAKFITELPFFLLTTFIQVTITYWITNLYASAKRYFIFLGIVTLISFASVGLGSVLSVIADTPEQAQALQSPILLPLMVFGGFFLNNQSGQKWLTWLKYISWFYYGNEVLLINQWADVNNLPCEGLAPGLPCYHNGDEVLKLVDFNKSHFGYDIGLIVVLCWRSKISNKKSENKQNSQSIIKSIQTDYSTNISVSQPIDTRNSLSTAITIESSNASSPNNETLQLLKNQQQQQQTSIIKDQNNSISQLLPKFFHFGSSFTSLIKKNEQQIPNVNLFETSIEREQILDREFQSLDIDADGYVSIADLQSVLKNFSHICNSNEVMLRIFKELDINDDKRISKQEFKLYKNILLEREKHFNQAPFEEKLSSVFALFDRNQDNYISPHEIRETMHNLGENINDDLIKEMMQTADIDHDGRISRDEFKNLLNQLLSKK